MSASTNGWPDDGFDGPVLGTMRRASVHGGDLEVRPVSTNGRRALRRMVGLVGRGPLVPADLPGTSALLRRAGATVQTDGLDCVLAANVHGLYCVPRSSAHRPACQAILRGDAWEPDTIALICATDPTGDVVTAGAFFGDLLPAIAKSRLLDARVFAFEPSRENHRCAQITVALNGLDSVTLERAALAAGAGVATLATSDEDGVALGGGSHLADGSTSARAEQVRTARIDDVVPSERRVAVIQLDVEGHEQQALEGAARTIERCRPLLVLESVPSDAWFEEHLAPHGYRPDGLVHWNRVFRSHR